MNRQTRFSIRRLAPSVPLFLVALTAALGGCSRAALRHEGMAGAMRGDGGLRDGWYGRDFDDSGWEVVYLPHRADHPEGGGPAGVVWYRRAVEVPASWDGCALTLRLGPIDGADTVWFNGTEVGRTGPETPGRRRVSRRYIIPARRVFGGDAVLAVRVSGAAGSGRFVGTPQQMALSFADDPSQGRVDLAGSWRRSVPHPSPVE